MAAQIPQAILRVHIVQVCLIIRLALPLIFFVLLFLIAMRGHLKRGLSYRECDLQRRHALGGAPPAPALAIVPAALPDPQALDAASARILPLVRKYCRVVEGVCEWNPPVAITMEDYLLEPVGS